MKNVSKEVPELGNKLGMMRTKNGFSQSDLAEEVGMSRPNYTAIENQVPGRFLKDYQLKILADKLHISTDYLLGRIPDPHPHSDLIDIITTLQVSSDTINKIKRIHEHSTLFYEFNIFEDFMNYFEDDFWEIIGLYKKVNSYYQTQYKFVLDFTNDIYPPIVDFNHLNSNLDNFIFERKYFYVDKTIVRELYKMHHKIFSDDSLSLNKKWNKLSILIDNGKFSEKYIFCYNDPLKTQEFVESLNNIKENLDNFSRLMDFDEAGLIFSFFYLKRNF